MTPDEIATATVNNFLGDEYWIDKPVAIGMVAAALTSYAAECVKQEQERHWWHTVEQMTARMGNTGFDWQGPLFKPEHHYLAGSPLGTTCWYVRVLHDDIVTYYCADTPAEAVTQAAAALD